jgi:hypothetical protein
MKLNAAGMRMSHTLSEVDPLNFLPHVYQTAPVMNGRYNFLSPIETSQLTMLNLLGTPKKDKKLFLYDSGNGTPLFDVIKESPVWFDKCLEPVSVNELTNFTIDSTMITSNYTMTTYLAHLRSPDTQPSTQAKARAKCLRIVPIRLK